jgi:hypothetical protein
MNPGDINHNGWQMPDYNNRDDDGNGFLMTCVAGFTDAPNFRRRRLSPAR